MTKMRAPLVKCLDGSAIKTKATADKEKTPAALPEEAKRFEMTPVNFDRENVRLAVIG
jgi:hypothetical protein